MSVIFLDKDKHILFKHMPYWFLEIIFFEKSEAIFMKMVRWIQMKKLIAN